MTKADNRSFLIGLVPFVRSLFYTRQRALGKIATITGFHRYYLSSL
jgi:hypothetical protein